MVGPAVVWVWVWLVSGWVCVRVRSDRALVEPYFYAYAHAYTYAYIQIQIVETTPLNRVIDTFRALRLRFPLILTLSRARARSLSLARSLASSLAFSRSVRLSPSLFVC